MDRDGIYDAQSCEWTIIVGDNKVVNLRFESMDLEHAMDCRYDYVLVRALQKKYAIYCEDHVHTIFRISRDSARFLT